MGSGVPVVSSGSGGLGSSPTTGTGNVVLATAPTLSSPVLGTPTSGNLVNCSGYTYANLSGTVPTWDQNTTGTASGLSSTLAVGNGGTGATSLAGANIPVTTANNTFTGTQSFTGTTALPSTVFTNMVEVATISTSPAATLNFYISTQSIMLFTSNTSANWTLNITYSSGTTLNSVLSIGQAVTIAFLVTNGATAFYNSATQIDGVAVIPKWQGGTIPSAGNANALDAYTFTIIKTAAATFTVAAALTKFA